MVAQPTHSCQLNLISSTFLLKTGKEVMHIVSIENISQAEQNLVDHRIFRLIIFIRNKD
jgi:hypothetical protein